MEFLQEEDKKDLGFTTKPRGHVYEFYLGEIEEASKYTTWFNAIRNASEDDLVKIYINSTGGDMMTALQFLRVLGDTEAQVVCSVEGACMSAATIIFLAGDVLEVTPNSLFMLHNYSGGTYGKGGEQHAQISFERAWSEKLFRGVYKDFMSAEEITSMLDGKDFWFSSEEVLERGNKYMTARTKKEEE